MSDAVEQAMARFVGESAGSLLLWAVGLAAMGFAFVLGVQWERQRRKRLAVLLAACDAVVEVRGRPQRVVEDVPAQRTGDRS